MRCQRHPFAREEGRFCPACLLEEALASRADADDEGTLGRRLTVLTRLGEGESASVFLVRQDEPAAGLLRLKTWHRRAAGGFLDRFSALRRELDVAAELAIAIPLAATVDGQGRPSVLSEFRQGVPILDAVRSGSLTHRSGSALLHPVDKLMGRLHARGLAHGSLVPGNVFVHPDLDSVFLVDFGTSPAFLGKASPADLIAHDRECLDALLGALAVTFPPRS